ncbi:hypothetical protein ABPG72_012496 [Tetrahymena utriculariae]
MLLFWALFPIYLLVKFVKSIVLVTNLLSSLQNTQQILNIVIINLYVALVTKFQPFIDRNNNKNEIISFLTLLITLILQQISTQQNMELIEVLVIMLHLSFLLLLIQQIIKIKFKCSHNKYLYCLLLRIFGHKIFNQLVVRERKTIIILFLWRKVFINLGFIRQKNNFIIDS